MPDTKGASEHVAYEIDRLFFTHETLVQDKVSGKLHDAVLESFAVHARNVVEFLYDPPEKDDVRGEHFFSDPRKWRDLVRQKPGELRQVQEQANKQISHITYARIGADKRWYVGKLTEQLHGVVRTFLDNAEEARMGPALLELKKSFRQ